MDRNQRQHAATAPHTFGDLVRTILVIAIVGAVIWRVAEVPDLSFLPVMACAGMLLSGIAIWGNRARGLDDEQRQSWAASRGVVNRSFVSRRWRSPSAARRASAPRRVHFRVRRDWRHRRSG
jgi:hypothetical protein